MATQTENSKISHFRGTWFQGYFYRVEKLLSAEKFTQWRNFLYLYLSLSWLGQCHKRPRNFHRSIIETKYKQSVLESSALFSQISHVNVVFDWSRQSREWAGVRGKGMCKCDLKNELPFLKKSQVIFIICCHFNSMYQYPVCLNLNTDLFFFFPQSEIWILKVTPNGGFLFLASSCQQTCLLRDQSKRICSDIAS